jgi:type IV pilus assembly protein PilB
LPVADFDSIVVEEDPEALESPLAIREHGMPPQLVTHMMIAALALAPDSRVLQVGTGNGYAAALLCRLGYKVWSLEQVPTVAAAASHLLQEIGCANVHVRVADGNSGWAEFAPFDAILLSMGDAQYPARLISQLRVGGHLVYVDGHLRTRRMLIRMTRTSDGHQREELGPVRYVARLGDIVVDMGVAERVEVEAASVRALRNHQRIGAELSTLPKVGARQVYRALALQKGLSFSEFSRLASSLDLQLAQSVPLDFARRHSILPIMGRDGEVFVATSNPDFDAQDLAKAFGGKNIEPVLVTATDLRRLFAAIELGDVELGHAKPRIGDEEAANEPNDLNLANSDSVLAHCGALANAIFLDAIGERASDVHIDRERGRTRVRIRVDGELRDLSRHTISAADTLGLINVLKVRADLDISERRMPQGGRMQIRAGEIEYDLRVQIQPGLHGESAVIRLLPRSMSLISIDQLGFPATVAAYYRRLLFSPAGLILVVGPTGSGKSTSLYAGLQLLARDTTRKVISIEDPIEYSIAGIEQTQVNPKIDFNFSTAMRSFVRLDPDVLFVGEIRDFDTAREAIRASQTGHIVLSTLHCNDATDAVQRLIDLDMHPNSIASELRFVVAQRLAKRICEVCREPSVPDPDIIREIFPNGTPAEFICFKGRGCQRCGGVGTWGRIAVVEAMYVTPHVRTAIAKRSTLDELREVALREGMHTMRDSALEMVRHGVIALDQLPRILAFERMAGG